MLKEYGYTSKQDKVYLQCFDANELKRIKHELEPKMGMDLKLVQLIAYTDWNETQQRQADGKWVNYSYDWMFAGGHGADCAVCRRHWSGLSYAGGGRLKAGAVKLTAMVKEAHASHLQVHPYTVRADQLPEYASNVNQLYDLLYHRADVDGLFTDFPDKAVQFPTLNAKKPGGGCALPGVRTAVLLTLFSVCNDFDPGITFVLCYFSEDCAPDISSALCLS